MHRKKFDSVLKSVSALLKAVAHPDRLRILGLLQDKEMDVTQLHQAMVISPSAVSQHLKLLKLQGLLNERKEGTHVYYSLKNNKLERIIGDIIEFQTQALSQSKEETALFKEMIALWKPALESN